MRRYVPINHDLALLLLRLVLAAVLLYHGWPKLTGFSGTVSFFQSSGIPAPAVSAAFATLAEVGGGLLMLAGIATDIAGLLIAVNMLGAIVTVHWANGFDFTKGGWEHAFTVLGIALAVALSGPGSFAAGSKS